MGDNDKFRLAVFLAAFFFTTILLSIAHAKWNIPYVFGVVIGFGGGFIVARSLQPPPPRTDNQ